MLEVLLSKGSSSSCNEEGAKVVALFEAAGGEFFIKDERISSPRDYGEYDVRK